MPDRCKYLIEHLEMKYRCTFNTFQPMIRGFVIGSQSLSSAQLSVPISHLLSCSISCCFLRLLILNIKAFQID